MLPLEVWLDRIVFAWALFSHGHCFRIVFVSPQLSQAPRHCDILKVVNYSQPSNESNSMQYSTKLRGWMPFACIYMWQFVLLRLIEQKVRYDYLQVFQLSAPMSHMIYPTASIFSLIIAILVETIDMDNIDRTKQLQDPLIYVKESYDYRKYLSMFWGVWKIVV